MVSIKHKKSLFAQKYKSPYGRRTLLGAISTAMAGALVAFSFGTSTLAAGDAHFSLSPSGGSYKNGSTLVVAISETSTSGDNTDAIQANLSYSSSLTYKSIVLTGPFTLCGQETGGGGAVSIGCASTTAKSGTQSIAKVTFSVAGKSGTAKVSMTSGSDIDGTSGNSVWNGGLPSASFSLKSATTTTKKSSPTTSSGSSSGSSKSSGSSNTTKPSTTPKASAKSHATTHSTSSKPSATPVATPATLPAASLTITVTDSQGKPIKGAKVVLNNHYSEYTNSQGKAGFTGINGGSYTVSATASGKKSAQSKLTIGQNQVKLLALKLTDDSPNAILIVAGIVGIVIILGAGYWYVKVFRNRSSKLKAPMAIPAIEPQPAATVVKPEVAGTSATSASDTEQQPTTVDPNETKPPHLDNER